MNRDPLLACRVLRKGTFDPNVSMTFKVYGGLHYIKGNRLPYFTLTYWAHRQGFPNQFECGGAGHEEIEKYFRGRFTDLARMHLSDINGAPMHAIANGWYYLAGALGGMGEKYTVLASKHHFPKAIVDPAKPWLTTDYRLPTPADALQMFAGHIRVPLEEARAIGAQIVGVEKPKERWAEIAETMRPRWRLEAAECIARHKLQVYGDPWDGEVPKVA